MGGHGVSFSPDGRILASSGWDDTIRLWDAPAGTFSCALLGHADGVFSVAYSPDGRILASGGWDNTVRLWDAATGILLRILTGHTDEVLVAFGSDGRVLASGGKDCAIRLWDVATGGLLRILEGHGCGRECGLQSGWANSSQWWLGRHCPSVGCVRGHPPANPEGPARGQLRGVQPVRADPGQWR